MKKGLHQKKIKYHVHSQKGTLWILYVCLSGCTYTYYRLLLNYFHYSIIWWHLSFSTAYKVNNLFRLLVMYLCHMIVDASQRHHAECVQGHLQGLNPLWGGAIHTPVRHEEHQIYYEAKRNGESGGQCGAKNPLWFLQSLPGEGNLGASLKPPYSSS